MNNPISYFVDVKLVAFLEQDDAAKIIAKPDFEGLFFSSRYSDEKLTITIRVTKSELAEFISNISEPFILESVEADR